MAYREYTPHPALQSYIDAYWTTSTDQYDATLHRILPDSCTDIIFNKGAVIYDAGHQTRMATGQSYLVGTMKTYIDILQNPGVSTIGIRFKPGGISAFYKLNLNEVTDLAVPYQDKQLYDIIYRDKDLIASLDSYFLNKRPSSSLPFLSIIADIKIKKGQIKVSELIDRHAMSERKLERLFKEHTGISAIGMIRLERFTVALHHIKANHANRTLSEIACLSGYYDQAHLCNDVKSFTGMSPAQL